MTLIIATLTPRGVVLVADRRSLTSNFRNGEHFVLSEATEKILIGPDIAAAITGGHKTAISSPRDIIEKWIVTVYTTALPFREQVESFFEQEFKDGINGGFVIVCYRADGAQSCRTTIDGKIEFDQLTEPRRARMKFNGSGNQIAGKLVDMIMPPLAAFDLPDVVEYSAFLITATHSIMKYAKKSEPSVGYSVIAAVIDYRGAHLVKGDEYRLDTQKS